jgi:hypothetical protein
VRNGIFHIQRVTEQNVDPPAILNGDASIGLSLLWRPFDHDPDQGFRATALYLHLDEDYSQ